MCRLLCFALLLLSVGCARPVPPPVLPVTGEELLQRVREYAAAFESLRGLAKVRIDSGGRSLSGTQVLLVQEPDLLRAETLSPFGNPLLLVAADGVELRAMVPGEGRFFSGSASAANIQRFTRLPLQISDLVHLLLVEVPIVAYREARVEATEEGEPRLLLFADGEMRQELVFDRELRLRRSSYHEGGRLRLRIDYDRFAAGSPPFPRSIRLQLPAEESEATLNFTEVEVNPVIPPERFILNPPAGYTLEPLP